ncbi:MAG: succinate--CoA ligase subunit alpha [Myxococcales bacterium]|nr:MAG: succinate--CoA ligase subunit alpha [Myxococcales bacterium]
MSILADKNTRLAVQGITGKSGQFHARLMAEYGTNVVAGVTPGRGGAKHEGVPLFNTVHDAVRGAGANASVIFVPPPFAADAIMEAADAGVELIVCITEGIPVLDMARVKEFLADKPCRLVGPNCPGLITPGEAKLGIMPGEICAKGRVGIVSRSGTLTYSAVRQITALGLGQSTAIGIGGDPITGLSFVDVLELFEADGETEAVVLIGEIGGDAEERAARFARDKMTKPVVAFVAGQTAPPGRRMGHAGAIVSGGQGTAAAKIAVMRDCGLRVIPIPTQIGQTVAEVLGAKKAG